MRGRGRGSESYERLLKTKEEVKEAEEPLTDDEKTEGNLGVLPIVGSSSYVKYIDRSKRNIYFICK